MTDPEGEWPVDELRTVFARLADALDPRHDLIDTVDLLVNAAITFTSAVQCGVVLADGKGVLHLVGSTGEDTSDVEEVELRTQHGPCLDSYRTGHVVETPDVRATQQRWRGFARIAERCGIRAGYALPLTLRGERLGAMNLFFDRVHAITDQEAATAQALVEFATIGIVQRRALQHHADRAEQLQHALDSRVVIEQAKGAIAYQRSVSIDEAFKLLRQHARNTGTRIHDVAERIVHKRLSL